MTILRRDSAKPKYKNKTVRGTLAAFVLPGSLSLAMGCQNPPSETPQPPPGPNTEPEPDTGLAPIISGVGSGTSLKTVKATEEKLGKEQFVLELSGMDGELVPLRSFWSGDGKVKLVWTPIRGAVGYEVALLGYRLTEPDDKVKIFSPDRGSATSWFLGRDQTSVEVTGLTNVVGPAASHYYSFKVKAIMSGDMTKPWQGSSRYQLGGDSDVYPAKPELKLPKEIPLKQMSKNGEPEEVVFNAKDVLGEFPLHKEQMIRTKWSIEICPGDLGCGGKVEVNYSDDKLTKITDG